MSASWHDIHLLSGWVLRQRQTDQKTSISGDRLKGNLAGMLVYDASGHLQPEASAFSDALGGEEGLEDMVTGVFRDARTVIRDLHQQVVQLAGGANPQLTFAIHGLDRIVDEVRPYLVQ